MITNLHVMTGDAILGYIRARDAKAIELYIFIASEMQHLQWREYKSACWNAIDSFRDAKKL